MKTIKKFFILFYFLFFFQITNGQIRIISPDFKGCGGCLSVEDNVWRFWWLNNEYKYVSDVSSLYFYNKGEVQVFYEDLLYLVNYKEDKQIIIQREKYFLISNKKFITIYNKNGQYSRGEKKYMKRCLQDIFNSISYMK